MSFGHILSDAKSFLRPLRGSRHLTHFVNFVEVAFTSMYLLPLFDISSISPRAPKGHFCPFFVTSVSPFRHFFVTP